MLVHHSNKTLKPSHDRLAIYRWHRSPDHVNNNIGLTISYQEALQHADDRFATDLTDHQTYLTTNRGYYGEPVCIHLTIGPLSTPQMTQPYYRNDRSTIY